MSVNKNCDKPTRYYSNKQEKTVAKMLGGKQTSNSGAALFSAGDCTAKTFLLECKTTMTPKKSFSIKKEWLDKLEKERMDMQMPHSALVFQFEPGGTNYFIIKDSLFKEMMKVFTEE